MIKKEEKDFSETKPFKRTAFLKTKIWSPFWLFKARGLFSGIILLIVGVFYFIRALVKNDLIVYYTLFFWLPGIYICIRALKRKGKYKAKEKDISNI
tara:strand:- start:1292 stop:1582 length:291 start_codon:yes stop_codon:yes gene_type:complete